MRITLSDAAMVTYAIPPERLKPLMTGRLSLDTLRRPDGDRAIVSTAVFCIRAGKRGSVLWNLPVNAAVQYTYVRSEEQRGIYILRVLAAPFAAASLLHLLVPAASRGRWSPQRLSSAGKSRDSQQRPKAPWVSHQVESEGLPLELELLPPENSPVPSLDGPMAELAGFLFRRTSMYFWLRGRWLWRTPFVTAHAHPLPAVPGRLRIPFWQEMGLLSPAETVVPLASHFFPTVVLTCRPARPVWSL